MPVHPESDLTATPTRAAGDLLALGFAATVAMWAFGYFMHLPEAAPTTYVTAEAARLPAPAPGQTETVQGFSIVMLAGITLCMLVAGFYAGRYTPRGWQGGALTGLVTGLLNMMVLGGILRSGGGDASVFPAILIWGPTSILFTTLCGAAGAAIGQRRRPTPVPRVNWARVFGTVAICATVLLIFVGGMVTGYQAGLDVPDWPNSFGYNMFLYPIADMPGGIYFEHSHRLLGSLTGFTTLVFAIYLFLAEPRKWVCWFAVGALALVIFQGVLGGLRVTGFFTLTQDRGVLRPSIVLAIIHGVTGQIFLATLVALVTIVSTTWRESLRITERASAETDRTLGLLALSMLLIQLVTGALVRHIEFGLLLHITLAVIVLVMVGAFAVRTWGLYENAPILPAGGIWLTIGVSIQLMLGLAALLALMIESGHGRLSHIQAWITTIHQTLGALLLGGTTSLTLWHYRLVRAPQATTAAPASSR